MHRKSDQPGTGADDPGQGVSPGNGRGKRFVPVLQDGPEGIASETICPIISEGDAVGSVIFLSRDEKQKMGETELKLASSAAGFLGKQMEQ